MLQLSPRMRFSHPFHPDERRGQTGVRRRVVKILCNKADAEMLRDATETLCPEALPEMEQSIKLSGEIK